MSYYNYNGKLYPTGSFVIGVGNRGLRYGDGLFETMKCIGGQVILLDEHLARLWKGMQLLQFDIPKLITPDKLQQEIFDLLKKNRLTSARVRLTIIRGEGGLYDAKNIPHFIIEVWPLAENTGKWNQNGLHAGVYHEAKKTADNFANCKHNNYLPYFMGALFAKSNKFNDAIILNNYNRVCDSTIANIFIIKNDTLVTPSLLEGCIAGVMRKFLLHTLPALGIDIVESNVTVEMLLDADEIFFTNSIYNMRWVTDIDNNQFTCIKSRQIYDLLCKTNPEVFC